MSSEAELRIIPIVSIDSHPRNPRLALREDVIEGIRAQLNGRMESEYALRVRPKGDRFEIISGHQRIEAAKRAKLKVVPCWVRDLDDDAAYMSLVTDNAQGELSPLEIGLHALECVGRKQGKKGEGLEGYAKKIGRSKQYISQIFQAAEVARTCQVNLTSLEGYTQHLFTIHALPESLWSAYVSALVKGEWTVVETEEAVNRARSYLKSPAVTDLPEYLPTETVAESVGLERLTISDVKKLAGLARDFAKVLKEALGKARAEQAKQPKAMRVEIPDLLAEWNEWLVTNRGGKSWSDREVRRKRDEIEERIFELVESEDQPTEFRLIVSDFRKAVIEDHSVDLILTDPPYPKEFLPLYADLATFAARVLKPGGSLLALVGQSYLPEIMAALNGPLRYQWTLGYLTPGGQAVQLFDRKVNTFWKPVLWFVNGPYKGDWVGDVCQSPVNDNDKRFHKWGQSERGMLDVLERFAKAGNLVLDPFAGAGTSGVAAVFLGCQFIGIDSDAKIIEVARKRITEVSMK